MQRRNYIIRKFSVKSKFGTFFNCLSRHDLPLVYLTLFCNKHNKCSVGEPGQEMETETVIGEGQGAGNNTRKSVFPTTKTCSNAAAARIVRLPRDGEQ